MISINSSPSLLFLFWLFIFASKLTSPLNTIISTVALCTFIPLFKSAIKLPLSPFKANLENFSFSTKFISFPGTNIEVSTSQNPLLLLSSSLQWTTITYFSLASASETPDLSTVVSHIACFPTLFTFVKPSSLSL